MYENGQDWCGLAMGQEGQWKEGVEGYYGLQYWFFGYFCEYMLIIEKGANLVGLRNCYWRYHGALRGGSSG